MLGKVTQLLGRQRGIALGVGCRVRLCRPVEEDGRVAITRAEDIEYASRVLAPGLPDDDEGLVI